ncbi:MAG: hypothetical protein HYW49_07805 [Deltaproteobacteria bacterium]|nr:hypothetical protein [Deltaproteobacteria bacterium]
MPTFSGFLLAALLFPLSGEPFGHFRNTYYYLAEESDYASQTPEVPVRDPQGTEIACVARRFKSALDIEGSGKLADGRVVNFAGKIDGEIRYVETVHPHGRGVGDCALIPFGTVAVDPKTIPLGSLVRIDETAGMRLPDGTLHTGIWRAEDIGGAIKGDRIDLFVGNRLGGSTLDRAHITHLQALTVRIVALPTQESCVNGLPR